ncbi:MAG: dihydroneopterin aldolase [Campylobacterales bacterium]|nr:dihydroneopterin aldolase [Campylobacterales bacterium]
MRIHIDALSLTCIIGLLEHERLTPQRVIVTCTIDYRYTDGEYIDYAIAVALIRKTLEEERFELLETAIEVVAQRFKARFDAIEELYLHLCKPDILPNVRVGLSETFTF